MPRVLISTETLATGDGMPTSPPWHNTHTAIAGLFHIRKKLKLDDQPSSVREEVIATYDEDLQGIASRAHFVEVDRYGRELWRAPKRDYAARLVVDPRKDRTGPLDALPKLIWVGQGRPPDRVFAPRT